MQEESYEFGRAKQKTPATYSKALLDQAFSRSAPNSLLPSHTALLPLDLCTSCSPDL